MRWLDRYRWILALAGAAVAAPLLIAWVGDVLDIEWPGTHSTLLSVLFGVIAWWLFEIILIYLTAFWETEHDRLARDRGLPRAIARTVQARRTSPKPRTRQPKLPRQVRAGGARTI